MLTLLLLACNSRSSNGTGGPPWDGHDDTVPSGDHGASDSSSDTTGLGTSDGTGPATAGDEGSSSGAGDPTSPPPGRETVSAFIAAGFQGRRVVSCDKGRTWVYDQSDRSPDEYDCRATPEGDPSCDHQGNASTGLAFGSGILAGSFGWGFEPASVRTTTNGRDWEIHLLENSYGGMVFTGEVFLLGARSLAIWDLDTTEVLDESIDTGLPAGANHIRNLALLDLASGRTVVQIAVTGEHQGVAIGRYADADWFAPTPPVAPNPLEPVWLCLSGNVAGHGDHIAMMGFSERVPGFGDAFPDNPNRTYLCISHDGGGTWTQRELPDNRSGALVSTGQEFVYWANGTLYRSEDAEDFTVEAVVGPANFTPSGSIDYDDGVFVTIS